MTVNELSWKIDKLQETLIDLVDSINNANNKIVLQFYIVACALIIAVIIAELFLVKFLKTQKKEIKKQKEEIQKIKEEINNK